MQRCCNQPAVEAGSRQVSPDLTGVTGCCGRHGWATAVLQPWSIAACRAPCEKVDDHAAPRAAGLVDGFMARWHHRAGAEPAAFAEYVRTRTTGYSEWEAYLLGKQDNLPKTPEWQEAEIGVPARQVRALARKWGTHKTYHAAGGQGGGFGGGPAARRQARSGPAA